MFHFLDRLFAVDHHVVFTQERNHRLIRRAQTFKDGHSFQIVVIDVILCRADEQNRTVHSCQPALAKQPSTFRSHGHDCQDAVVGHRLP
jgi:hypothetical protein